jgi:hypothetical protein
LASCIDGVNLAAHQVGDVLEVTARDGNLLIAEEWAVSVVATESRRPIASRMPSQLIRPASDQLIGAQEQRRAEDRFREELRDSRATIISKNPV